MLRNYMFNSKEVEPRIPSNSDIVNISYNDLNSDRSVCNNDTCDNPICNGHNCCNGYDENEDSNSDTINSFIFLANLPKLITKGNQKPINIKGKSKTNKKYVIKPTILTSNTTSSDGESSYAETPLSLTSIFNKPIDDSSYSSDNLLNNLSDTSSDDLSNTTLGTDLDLSSDGDMFQDLSDTTLDSNTSSSISLDTSNISDTTSSIDSSPTDLSSNDTSTLSNLISLLSDSNTSETPSKNYIVSNDGSLKDNSHLGIKASSSKKN